MRSARLCLWQAIANANVSLYPTYTYPTYASTQLSTVH
jgi:hypothetical protein